MPRPGQVIIRHAHRGRVSVAEYPRTQAVGVRGGDALNLADRHRSILMGPSPTQGGPTTAADRAGESDGWPPLWYGRPLNCLTSSGSVGSESSAVPELLRNPANGLHVAQIA